MFIDISEHFIVSSGFVIKLFVNTFHVFICTWVQLNMPRCVLTARLYWPPVATKTITGVRKEAPALTGGTVVSDLTPQGKQCSLCWVSMVSLGPSECGPHVHLTWGVNAVCAWLVVLYVDSPMSWWLTQGAPFLSMKVTEKGSRPVLPITKQ